MLLADEAWQRGDLADGAHSSRRRRSCTAAGPFFARGRIAHLLKAASGPAAPAARGLWEWGVDSYRSRRYRARYREARRNVPEGSPLSEGISVIIPTYCRADVIGECLDALDRQSLPPLEVIVVDQSPDTMTRDIVAAAGGRRRSGTFIATKPG